MGEEIQDPSLSGETSRVKIEMVIDDEQKKVNSERNRQSQLNKSALISKEKEGLLSSPPKFVQFDPNELMPKLDDFGHTSISLFSGGGGLDLGFERAGFTHHSSYDYSIALTQPLIANRPDWKVFRGEKGDVTKVDWKSLKISPDVLHGGPPCQPYSRNGSQGGSSDDRDMVPEFTRAVLEIEPKIFVMENVPGILDSKFTKHIDDIFMKPLAELYEIHTFTVNATDVGVPQSRTRIFFIGVRNDIGITPKNPLELLPTDFENFIEICGVRKWLGLKISGEDGIAPTFRSGMTGKNHSTSILSSTSAKRKWEELGIWPNGIQKSKERAWNFPTKDGTYRLCSQEVALLQGFPKDWVFDDKAMYKRLGSIGNSVPPPMAYYVAKAVRLILLQHSAD